VSLRFVPFAAWRYFKARRKSGGAAATILSIVGVAAGVMTLIAVLAVMNGFQLGFIESILELSSYHIQIKAGPPESVLRERLQPLAGAGGIVSLVPFSEHQSIAEGRYSALRGCLLRGLPSDVLARDPGFAAHVELVDGSFELDPPASTVLGCELARQLGVGVGDTVQVLALAGGSLAALAPAGRHLAVRGIFKSGYYEYDLGWAFISLQTAADLFPQEKAGVIGIKLADRFRDREWEARIRALLQGSGAQVATWRQFNRAFFHALLTEKVMMMVLIGLIFVVVGFNIYHTMRRTVRERYEELALFKALGAGNGALQAVFTLDGLLIGLAGGTLGLLGGLLLAANINQVFALTEDLVNIVLALLQRFISPLLGEGGERFSIFSPAYFYLSEVPARVLLPETLLINLFAVFSAGLAAFGASARVAEVRPAEILRYE